LRNEKPTNTLQGSYCSRGRRFPTIEPRPSRRATLDATVPIRYDLRRGVVENHTLVAIDWSTLMAWGILVLAGMFEIGWAIGLKYSQGFSRLVPTAITVLSMVVSMFLLGVAVQKLPLGTAYAVWTGIGAVGTVVLGIVLFGESTDLPRLISIGLVLAGIVGLKLFAHDAPAQPDPPA
jgi:quaternary ammonium compound-resistance protein SugE